jgi:prepilin-type processing-associated H-X9-DG protein/prepilin-type N-terminal cleavage/methylation domain-containing protein
MGSVSRDNYYCSAGFTLVELLVVVGVIAIVIGLLLPALSSARRSVGGITCESNFRQWAMATQMYANENNGFLPRRGQGVGATLQVTRPTDWFNALPPLMKGKEYGDVDPTVSTLVSTGTIPRPPDASVWICPQANDMPGTYYWSFGMNMALSVWEANQNNGQPNKITGVGSTTSMVLFADAPGNYCSIYPSKIAGGYNPVARHNNNTVNICFLDGHVETIPGSYIGCGKGVIEHADVRWLPPGSTWNSAQ